MAPLGELPSAEQIEAGQLPVPLPNKVPKPEEAREPPSSASGVAKKRRTREPPSGAGPSRFAQKRKPAKRAAKTGGAAAASASSISMYYFLSALMKGVCTHFSDTFAHYT